jgi:hypothetical protein
VLLLSLKQFADVVFFLHGLKTIYDHAGVGRGGLFPGGPDTYREICYTRDDGSRSFLLREHPDPALED